MVSNLKSAKHAIEAELSHAKQGIAYYAARVEALEIALHQLENVEEPAEKPVARKKYKAKATGQKARATQGRGLHRMAGKNGAKTASASGASVQRGKEPARGKKTRAVDPDSGSALPTTGAEFWLKLINEQPQSAVEISNAAIATLGLKPDQKRQIQKIKQRVAPALANLVATQKISDSGAGRERRFYKAA